MSTNTQTSLEAHDFTHHPMAWSELKRWALLGASVMSDHPHPEGALLNALALSWVSHSALPSPQPPARPVEAAPKHLGPHPSEVERLARWLWCLRRQSYADIFALCAYLTSLAEAGRTLPLRQLTRTLTLLNSIFELHKGLSRCPLSPEALWLSIGARGRWLLHEVASFRTAKDELVSCLASAESIESIESIKLPSRIKGEALIAAHSALEERFKALPHKDKTTQECEARVALRRSFGALWLRARPQELSELISPKLKELIPLFEQEELRELSELWKKDNYLTLLREATD